ncbi:DNA-methyltransferase [Natranaerobius trueperi]|uniref:Methyltransferase n=1 Tax=Natranaerobius trueperi TaxID=759412 RepID=A0A226C2W8_9FIRM|nr:site-specific DNA-methyltransferase [Natranaerobius trueperi]OWZ84974.1 DNA methylase [Natranaerobius trueperi]
MANTSENRVLELSFDKLTENEMIGIQVLSENFSNNDITIIEEKNRLLVQVNKVDIDKLRKLVLDYNKNSFLKTLLKKILDIKSYGIKENKRWFTGYSGERKVKDRKDKEKSRGKFYYAKDNQFSKTNNHFPSEFENQIICDDSEKVLKQLPDNCIDLVFTSPPYNFGLEYDNHKDYLNWTEYFDKLFRIFKECIRVVKYGGRIVVNVQPLFSDYIPIHHFISNFFIENKLIWKAEILWEKNNYNCKYTAWGSWKSPSNPYFKYSWEFLEVFCKGSMKKNGDKEKIDITADEFKEWVYGKWSIAPERNMQYFNHPSIFPEELARRVLKLFSYQEDVILDPFIGSGTTAVVAKSCNRRYFGIDLSNDYCKIANERLNLQNS